MAEGVISTDVIDGGTASPPRQRRQLVNNMIGYVFGCVFTRERFCPKALASGGNTAAAKVCRDYVVYMSIFLRIPGCCVERWGG